MPCLAIDGDTLICQSAYGVSERIRIVGVDTPERGCAGAAAATRFLGEITRTSVLIFERVARDRYGRTLARVYVNSVAPENLLSTWIISAGHGHPRRASCR